MRHCMLPALFALAAQPLAAWEPVSQNELAALLGEEPQTTILQCGQPQVPTREEALRAGVRYELERNALKRALLFRVSLSKADRGRISPETNRATAQQARRYGAPETFCRLLERLASGTLSRRQEYAVEQALRQLIGETYAVDSLQMRLVSEALGLPPREHLAFMLALPVGSMFDLVPAQLPPQQQVLSDILAMTNTMRREIRILQTVQDLPSADAAATQLLPLLPVWGTTLPTRYHRAELGAQMDAATRWAAQLMQGTMDELLALRRDLHKKGWFGSTRLETVDELLR